jgi:hypothetical protein
MFLARDRNRFSRELLALMGGRPAKPKLVVVDDKIERMAAVNAVLEDTIAPMLEAYAEIVRKAGRSCDFKVLPGSAESFPTRAAVAEFWLDLTEVPGVAQYFMRFECEGAEWRVISRPGLGRKLNKNESGEMLLAAGKKAGASVEGALQQFIRLVF